MSLTLTLEGKISTRPNSLGNSNAKRHGGYSKKTSEKDQAKYQALVNIKERSRRRGYESDLELSDLPEIPDFCPVLGIRIKHGTLKSKDASPSVDRKNTNLPYLKKYRDNLVFISHRANRIKADATLDELRKVFQYMAGSILTESRIASNGREPCDGNKAEAETHRERLNEATSQTCEDAIVRTYSN